MACFLTKLTACGDPFPRWVRLRSFTYLLISERSDKCPMRFEHVCVGPTQPGFGLASRCILVRKNRWMVGRPAAPVEAVGKESETGSDVNGKGPKLLGGGSHGGHGGCVAGSHTAWRVFTSV